MKSSKIEYISNYNKENYKIYQFRVKKEDKKLIDFLDNLENRNKYILSKIHDDAYRSVYTIEEIKHKIMPVLEEYGVTKAWIFGSYARGEATVNSDVDILLDEMTNNDDGWGGAGIFVDLKDALEKDVDIVFMDSIRDKEFLEEVKKDRIQIK